MEKITEEKALTLIEIIIAIFIFGLLMTGLVNMFRTGSVMGDISQNKINLQEEARLIKMHLSRDIKNSQGNVAVSDDNEKITFFDSDIIYRRKEGDDSILEKVMGASTLGLTDNLENLEFSFQNNRIDVKVDLATDRDLEYTLEDSIYARANLNLVDEEPIQHTFTHRPDNFNEEEVYLAGEFNSWNPRSIEMQEVDSGAYEVTLVLSAGEYEYKFVRYDSSGEEDWFPEGDNLTITLPE